MADRFEHGDFVVTPDYRRGFVLMQRSAERYEVAFFTSLGCEIEQYHPREISISGREPNEFEMVEFAKWSLAR